MKQLTAYSKNTDVTKHSKREQRRLGGVFALHDQPSCSNYPRITGFAQTAHKQTKTIILTVCSTRYIHSENRKHEQLAEEVFSSSTCCTQGVPWLDMGGVHVYHIRAAGQLRGWGCGGRAVTRSQAPFPSLAQNTKGWRTTWMSTQARPYPPT